MSEQNEQNKQKVPCYKKAWFWVVIIVAVLFVIIISFAGNGSEQNQQTNLGSKYYIGDSVTSGDVQFVVNSVYDTKQLGSSLVGDHTDYNFIVIEITVKNNTDSEITLTSSCMTLKLGNSTYEINSGSIYLDNGFYILKDIGAGISKTFSIAYEVSTESTADDYTLVVKGGSWATSKEIILKSK